MIKDLHTKICQLIKSAITELPDDVMSALQKSIKKENGTGKSILEEIVKNCEHAKLNSKSICQDTGTLIFYVKHPKGISETKIKKTINKAVASCTKNILLRPNSINTLTEKNIGNIPTFYSEESQKLEINLLLKGGGSENVSTIYQLPCEYINALRDFDGVRKCVLDAVMNAQGRGCPPYVVGVYIGGSVEEAAHFSKKQLLRQIQDKNKNQKLRKLEKNILDEVNELKIGPMGLGGNVTALAVKIGSGLRHPASFFVGISMSCWCLRREKL